MKSDDGPGASEVLVEAGFAVGSGFCALFAFGSAFGGADYLVVGLAGVLIGVATGVVGIRLRQPVLMVFAELVALFLLVGPAIAARSTTVGGFLPAPNAVSVMARTTVTGWANLLATAPVIGNSRNLLVIPFFCGAVCGAASMVLASRVKRFPFALLPSTLLLVTGILFGTDSSSSRSVTGGILAMVLLSWAAYRTRRRRLAVLGPSVSGTRLVWASAILVGCGTVGIAVAPNVPLASAHLRYVLRDHIEPPFDVDVYPSPLGAFRNYVLPSDLANKPLFQVSGALPENSLIRISTMDAYDGMVFNVAGGAEGTSASGNFATVGTPVSDQSCPLNVPCRSAPETMRVKILDYQNVWLPDSGIVRSVSFQGPDAEELTDAFRYNVATNAAAVTTGLHEGDSYTLSVSVPQVGEGGGPVPQAALQDSAAPVVLPAPQSVPTVVGSSARSMSAGADTDFQRMEDLTHALSTQGYYSDGFGKEAPSLPGHGAFRMAVFLGQQQPIGDGEQYAAALDLMARSLGLPARVVLGVVYNGHESMTVMGKDVKAWVEVDFSGIGWYPFFPTPPKTNKLIKRNPPVTLPTKPSIQSQPHSQSSTDPGNVSNGAASTAKGLMNHSKHSRLVDTLLTFLKVVIVALVVLLVLFGPPLLVIAQKARRRSRRRRASTPSARVAGGWLELVDHARDFGTRLPKAGTRLEHAGVVGGSSSRVALLADLATFGPNESSDADVDTFWELVDQSLFDIASGHSWWRKMRAKLSLASLFSDSPSIGSLSASRE